MSTLMLIIQRSLISWKQASLALHQITAALRFCVLGLMWRDETNKCYQSHQTHSVLISLYCFVCYRSWHEFDAHFVDIKHFLIVWCHLKQEACGFISCFMCVVFQGSWLKWVFAVTHSVTSHSVSMFPKQSPGRTLPPVSLQPAWASSAPPLDWERSPLWRVCLWTWSPEGHTRQEVKHGGTRTIRMIKHKSKASASRYLYYWSADYFHGWLINNHVNSPSQWLKVRSGQWEFGEPCPEICGFSSAPEFPPGNEWAPRWLLHPLEEQRWRLLRPRQRPLKEAQKWLSSAGSPQQHHE